MRRSLDLDAHSRVRARLLSGLLAGIAALALPVAVARAGTPYVVGDVFGGIGDGRVKEFTPTGTLVQTLDDTTFSAATTGMCFDSAGNST